MKSGITKALVGAALISFLAGTQVYADDHGAKAPAKKADHKKKKKGGKDGCSGKDGCHGKDGEHKEGEAAAPAGETAPPAH